MLRWPQAEHHLVLSCFPNTPRHHFDVFRASCLVRAVQCDTEAKVPVADIPRPGWTGIKPDKETVCFQRCGPLRRSGRKIRPQSGLWLTAHRLGWISLYSLQIAQPRNHSRYLLQSLPQFCFYGQGTRRPRKSSEIINSVPVYLLVFGT